MAILCVATVLLDFWEITYTPIPLYNRLISATLPLVAGFGAVAILAYRCGVKIFSRPERLWYLLPCLFIAVNNFPFISCFSGNMHLQDGVDATAWMLFIGYCLFTGLFEEFVFRGVVFPLVAERLPDTKKGLFLAVLFSSVVFGLSHLFNLFMGADPFSTLLQVGYSTLTGGMFTFALIQTKSIFSCVLLHAIYNFCGLLFSTQGLGTGVVFDLPTGIMMAVGAILVGIFVVYKTWNYPDDERTRLYGILHVKAKTVAEKENK